MIQINTNPSARELRQFAGIYFPAFCALVGVILFWKLGLRTAPYVLWTTGVVLAVAGLARPKLIKPVFVGLMYATYPIGWVMSYVLLGAVFFLVVTPIGLVMRLSGRDPMQRRFDKAATSYWVNHEQPTSDSRYFEQY